MKDIKFEVAEIYYSLYIEKEYIECFASTEDATLVREKLYPKNEYFIKPVTVLKVINNS